MAIPRVTASVKANDNADRNSSACGFERASCRYRWPCALSLAEQSRRPGCVLPQNRERRKGRGSMATVVNGKRGDGTEAGDGESFQGQCHPAWHRVRVSPRRCIERIGRQSARGSSNSVANRRNDRNAHHLHFQYNSTRSKTSLELPQRAHVRCRRGRQSA